MSLNNFVKKMKLQQMIAADALKWLDSNLPDQKARYETFITEHLKEISSLIRRAHRITKYPEVRTEFESGYFLGITPLTCTDPLGGNTPNNQLHLIMENVTYIDSYLVIEKHHEFETTADFLEHYDLWFASSTPTTSKDVEDSNNSSNYWIEFPPAFLDFHDLFEREKDIIETNIRQTEIDSQPDHLKSDERIRQETHGIWHTKTFFTCPSCNEELERSHDWNHHDCFTSNFNFQCFSSEESRDSVFRRTAASYEGQEKKFIRLHIRSEMN